MQYDEMIAILEAGGVDIANFDATSAKTLNDLYEEIARKEVILVLHEGRACRIALTVEVMMIVGGRERIRQTKRVYPSGKTVVRKGVASLSETRVRGESPFDAVIRCIKEECGIEISSDQIRIPSIIDHVMFTHGYADLLHGFDEHESSVYSGVVTRSHAELLFVDFPSRPWPEKRRVVDDNGVKIHLEYEALPILESRLRTLRALDT